MTSVPVPVIGVVHTRYVSLEDTPIQAALNRFEHGVLEIDPAYQDGLDGLEGFDYAWLLTWLHHRPERSGSPPPMKQTPFLLRGTERQVGVFATRGPRRVSPIGLSLVQILGVTGSRVTFAGVDVVDGTPVIDLKPFVGRFDRPPGDPACGWFDQVTITEGVTPAALAAERRKPGE
jgi:tRNA-Thr(GGU) m(6)t(6)A37 methyltransferase TsaA